jgi:WD40 repeat protein
MKKMAFFSLIVAFITLICVAKPAHATLYGIDWDTSNLYSISTSDASLTLIGNTGISSPGTIEFSPNGTLYSFSVGSNSTLYTINPTTAAATLIGPLDLNFAYEGGLAFSPSGIAYGVNGDNANNPQLFTLNLSTGEATVVGTISGASRDINGLAWRSDGKLIGISDFDNSLVVIDPTTLGISTLATLNVSAGTVGGMTAIGSSGYFSTGGSGSNQLYSFDLFTGSYNLIGSFPSNIGTGIGISGLAETPSGVPEPSTMLFLGSGLLGLIGFRRKFRK